MSEYCAKKKEYPVVLSIGTTGEKVKLVQGHRKLRQSGVYDQRTAKAVKRFQRSQKLSADGVVGPSTWKKMFC